ncbi:hypothetical protein [Ferrovibrio sp.]|uniref:hypothetical protein n=1 Tax=Ferrovibrio sp. TaxID=1917215 RepID=UPI00311E7162
MNYLVDTSGRWWRWPSETLAERLGYPDPDFDLAAYAARNLGYVWLEVRADVTLLQFRAGMLSDAVLAALRPYLVKAIREKPVGLVYFASGWLEEAFFDSAPLLERIGELATLREPRMRDLFIRKPYDPIRWSKSGQTDLSSLFDIWRFTDGTYSEPIQRYLRNSGLITRTVMLNGENDGNLSIMYGGGGFSVYDSFSFASTVGRSIADQPDRAYGAWVTQSYAACRGNGDPQIDDIDAIVEEPGHDPRRRRYQRLILRWKLPTGETVLTGSSILNPKLSIPLDIGAD